MSLFHLTLSLGRSDSVTVEADSKTDLLSFYTNVSKAVVRNIKRIVFSKDYNINYVPTPFTPGLTYSKVIVTALSNSYSETYVLFNIKRSVTKDIIQKQFKKLLINNEPIVDFLSIQFYDEGNSPIKYNNLFQVQYKRNSKTYLENFYSLSWEGAKELAETLIDGEITEIREFIHFDPTVKKDKGIGYFKSVSVSMYSDNAYRTLKIPKVDTNIAHDVLLDEISKTFKVFGKTPIKEDLKLTYH